MALARLVNRSFLSPRRIVRRVLSACAALVAAVALAPTARAEEIYLDLVAALPVAEQRAEVELIDFGTVDARRHMLEGWSFDEQWKERTMVWSHGERSLLRFHLHRLRPLTARLTGKPLMLDWRRQRVTVLVNGREVGDFALWPWTWSYRVELPVEALRRGTNHLELRYLYTVQPREIDPLSQDPRELAVWWDRLRLEGVGSRAGPARPAEEGGGDTLELAAGSRVDFFFRLRPDSRLLIDAVEAVAGAKAPESSLVIEVRLDEEGAARELYAAAVGETVELALPAERSGLARLSLGLDEDAGDDARLRLLRPRIVGPEPVTPDRAGAGAEAATEWKVDRGTRANLLVYLVDTLRADHLSSWGHERPTSPRLDELARGGVVFTQAWAQSSWTRSSVASLFTGRQAWQHGVNQRLRGVPPEEVTLAERLAAAGYATAALVTNGNVSAAFGFDQGFDTFEHLRERRDREVHVQSDALHDAAVDWLATRPTDQPFFLYLHATDPHGPYTPRSPFREQLAPGVDPRLGELHVLRWLARSLYPRPQRLRHRLAALYDAEIAFNDAHFGRLLDELERTGLREETLVVVLSDHGEEFYEHGGWEHGQTLYEEQTRVPMLLRLPGGEGAGRRVDTPVQVADLLPTVLDRLGLPPADTAGRSLLPLIREGERSGEAERPVFSYLDLDGRVAQGVRLGSLKLVRYLRHPRILSSLELFDLASDPGETRNLAWERPVAAGYLLSLLRAAGADRPHQAAEVAIDPELAERLRALGYMQ